MPDARPEGAAPRNYRAFLSYDHDDKRLAHELHRKLESYRIDRDLVGRASATGNVPRSLSPIFLDRAELAAGRQLGDELDAALESSDFLIVVCSQFAAQSQYVNNEVRRFKQMGRSDRIIPYILSGEPGDPKRECFMPALKYQVRPDGTLGDGHDEIIGADARAQGDGPELAQHKVAARLMGVKLDEILRRAQVAERLRDMAESPQITPAVICTAIAGAVGPGDLIVDEALTSGRWLRAALGARNTPQNWLAHRGSALGWGLPAAVGAKLADPERRVMCVHGDGSFLFGVHALWTAARERLGVAVVIADNSGYEILRAGMEGLTGRPEGNWPGLALTDPPLDLVAIARGFGATAERIEHRDELAGALNDVWERAEGGPAVLVVPVSGRTPPVGYPLR